MTSLAKGCTDLQRLILEGISGITDVGVENLVESCAIFWSCNWIVVIKSQMSAFKVQHKIVKASDH